MKCQILFSGKNITIFSSAELAQRVVKVIRDAITETLLQPYNLIGQCSLQRICMVQRIELPAAGHRVLEKYQSIRLGWSWLNPQLDNT